MSNVDWYETHTKNIRRYLTGSNPIGVLKTHKLSKGIIEPCIIVLDIGVGMGNMAKYIRRLNAVPVCIDVIPEAFEAVKGVAEQTILTRDLKGMEPLQADLGICHLVVQHCDDGELIELLSGVLPHMKNEKEISIQFADRDVEEEDTYQENKEQFYIRSNDRLSEIVRECGGEVRFVDVEHKWPKYGVVWKIARVSHV